MPGSIHLRPTPNLLTMILIATVAAAVFFLWAPSAGQHPGDERPTASR